jgi:hypothetical protein
MEIIYVCDNLQNSTEQEPGIESCTSQFFLVLRSRHVVILHYTKNEYTKILCPLVHCAYRSMFRTTYVSVGTENIVPAFIKVTNLKVCSQLL